MTLELLQNYWWLLISVLGGILVFLLFVQGGQTMMIGTDSTRRELIANCMGRKWELTFTTLVTFGGALFASFPLFYSTSFGGAYWLWILILFSFIIQAVSYEYRSKKGNILGTKTYDTFLFINGSVGCILLGVAVSMFFFGGDFTVNRGNLLDGSAPVISRWGDLHGFEAIFDWHNLILGMAVLFLARVLGALYMMNAIDDRDFFVQLRLRVLFNGAAFVFFFVFFLVMLGIHTGYKVISGPDGMIVSVKEEPFKYLNNYLDMWWALATLLVGVVLVLFALIKTITAKHYTKGIWWAGIGTFLAVASLFWVAGYGDTAFYPSNIDAYSSLTIRNASSSLFTLQTMSYVSLIIPFVLAYIWYVWRSMDKKKLTEHELAQTNHKY